MEPASKGPSLRRPGDPPPRYGPQEENFTVEINYGGYFRGLGSSKAYVDGKVARFDGCEADTWSPLWLTDFMQQLGYNEPDKYSLYWLLPTLDLDRGLRIVDRDTDTLSMIAVVPKFQYFQMYVVHAQPPKKLPVKRQSNAKKKALPKISTSASASIVESAMSYDISSSSVIQILQDQALATQQSQTPLPGSLPECQFIASCRDNLPPPRSTTATLGLKRKKPRTKENMVPKV